MFAALPAPAAAQYGAPQPTRPPEAPQSRDRQPQVVSGAELQRGVACQIGRDPAPVEALLATAPYSPQERSEAARILRLVQRCQRSRTPISTAPATLRGAIAETLYESRFATAQAARSPALAAAPLLRVAAATTRDDAASLAPAYAMAECTAAGHGGPVRALLATEPGTAAQDAAFGALNPAFVACIASGSTLNVDAQTLRGILAETLYRWSVVQRDGPASPFAAPAPATP